jgi:CHAT domain-containing protein/tetratricopeptide (TPR) repeat protein
MHKQVVDLCVQDFVMGEFAICWQRAESLLLLSSGDVPHIVLQLWLISMQRLKEDVALAAGIERAMTYTANSPWRRALVELTIGKQSLDDVLPRASTPEERCQAFYYAGAREETLGHKEEAHRLFQQARGNSTDATEHTLASMSVLGLRTIQPAKSREEEVQMLLKEANAITWSEDRDKAPETAARAVALAREAFGSDHPITADAFGGLGRVLRGLRHIEEALICYQEALAIYLKVHGSDHPVTNSALLDIGQMHMERGCPGEALTYFVERLRICWAVLGNEHVGAGISLGYVGRALEAMGRRAAARYFYEQSLAVLKRTLGQGHPATKEMATALAEVGQEQAMEVLPEEILREAGRVPWELYGDSDPRVVGRLIAVARLLAGLRDLRGGYGLVLRAVALARGLLGDEHPQTSDGLDALGLLLGETEDYPEAERHLMEALAIRRKAFGEHNEWTRLSLDHLAWLMEKAGNLHAARQHLEDELTILRNLRGSDDPQTAGCLRRVGILAELTDDHARACACLEEALPLCRRELSGKHPALADVLCYLGSALLGLQRPLEAQPHLEEALAIRQGVFGPKHLEVARVLLLLGRAAGDTNDYRTSYRRLQEAVEIYKLLGGADDETEAAIVLFGKVLAQQGQGAAGRQQVEEIVVRREQDLGDSHPKTLWAKNELCGLLMMAGRFAQARAGLEEILLITKSAFGEEHPQTADILCSLGAACTGVGEGAVARRYLEQSLAIRRRVLGDDHLETAQSLHFLAYALEDAGDLTGALERYQNALAIRRHHLGSDSENTLATVNNIAVLLKRMGRYAEAEGLYDEVLAARLRTYGKDHIIFAGALTNAGAFLHATKKYEGARLCLERSVDIQRNLADSDRPQLAATLHCLGAVLADTSEFELAHKYFDEALALTRDSRGERTIEEATTLRISAWSHVMQGDFAQALAELQTVSRIYDYVLGNAFAAGSERQRKAGVLTPVVVLHEIVTLVSRHFAHLPDVVRAAFDLILHRKGIVAEALAVQRDGVLGGRYPELGPALHRLTAQRAEIAHLLLDGPGGTDPEAFKQRIAGLAESRERLESELAQAIPELKLEESFRAADTVAVAAAIPAGHTLVEFVRFPLCAFRTLEPEEQSEPLRYLAFVLPAGRPDGLRMLDLGAAERIDGLIARFRTALTRGGSEDRHFVPEPEAKMVGHNELGAELRRTIFDPLVEVVEDYRRLILSPDGDLIRLPFEILPRDSGSRLIDTAHFSYIASARDLLRLNRKCGRPPGADLIASDANYDLAVADQPCNDNETQHRNFAQIHRALDRRSYRFGRLPGSRIEGERIAALLGVSPHMGDAVTKERITSCCSPRILHLATHGFFLESALPLSPRAGTIPTDRLTLLSHQVDNPLLRSGMALAGANAWLRFQPLPPEAGNGILTAEEVTGLDLLDTSLVVLSACETGLGTEDFCDGIMGLRRSFGLAGAHTTVMSLWKVPDEQTQELMVGFYQYLLGGAPKAEALRLAQLDLKAKYPEPYFWGAFICQGDPGPLLSE